MAERTTARENTGAATADDNWWVPYRAVLRSRIRAQQSYSASFRIDLFSALVLGAVEFAEVWVIFANVRVLGGLDLDGVVVVFGLSYLCFSLAEMAFGHLDTIPTYIRTGTLDAFYLRPQPLLTQLMTSDLQLKRIARGAVGLAVLVVGLSRNRIDWDATTIAVLPITVICGFAIFAGVFVAAAGAQFFLINGAELTNAFTYGGAFASNQPASLFPGPLKMLFGFLLPVVFTGYLPTLALLHLPVPFGLPEWSLWTAPLAAIWMWCLGLWLWRLGVRHYQGGGG